MLKARLLVVSVHASLIQSLPSSYDGTLGIVVLLILLHNFSLFNKLSHIKVIFMLKYFLLIQLINVFIQYFENRTISQINYAWN